MPNNFYLYLFSSLCLLSLLLSDCGAALDSVYANQVFKDGETIVSSGSMFELGFFSTRKSKNRYLGIWYKKISVCTVVWVANRDTPITDNSGMLKLSSDGNLVILSGSNTMVWSSESTVSRESNNSMVVLRLLDSGNLVVSEMDNYNNIIWQSFDHPGDTLLSGMKIRKDLITGIGPTMEWNSWKSPDDPSTGVYRNILDTNGYPQMFGLKGRDIVSRLGPWNGLGYSGLPIETENQIYASQFVVNEKEIYSSYELKSSVVQRIVLTWDGGTRMMHWIDRTQEWILYGDLKVDSCDLFAVCGPYGSCNINKRPPCTCFPGFEPRNPE